jgi:hypothetical protein
LERFIVGTGRCGSTLLSRMLGENPETLSIFELLNGLDPSRRFQAEPMTGHEFADLLSAEQPVLTAVLKRGYAVEEVTYPFGRGRYGRGDGVPWMLVSTLPRWTDDPDALFDDTVAFLTSQEARPPVEHFRAVLAFWMRRFGRTHWMERAGSSIDYLEQLAQAFPGARVVHIHRDGPEAALSMREHHAFRLPICMMYNAPVASGRTVRELGVLDFAGEPTDDDPVTQILNARPPAQYFGRYWCDQVIHGFRALRLLDRAQYLEVSFEDLVTRPREELERVRAFFELGPDRDGWIDRAAALSRGVPPRRAPELPAEERKALDAACAAGMKLIGRAY